MAVFGAVLANILRVAALIVPRRNFAGVVRPFVSQLGTPDPRDPDGDGAEELTL
jgi:hypothetical protein